MRTTTLRLYSLEYKQAKTYLAVALFVAGNILLPQLCHLVPQGGIRWLPIYFFTLVGAYKYGWKVGLLTAIVSPLVNSALFGMPAVAVLPAVLLKSVLLAVAAGYAAMYFRKASLIKLSVRWGNGSWLEIFIKRYRIFVSVCRVCSCKSLAVGCLLII